MDSISPRPPSQSICAAGFPVAAVQVAATVLFAPSIRGFGPFVKLTTGSTKEGGKKGDLNKNSTSLKVSLLKS